MPRAKRVLVPGAVYHVYNRVGRGEHLFRDKGEAGRLLARIGETASRWISRGTRRRQEDEEYRNRLEDVDRAIASAGGQVS